jgi:ubiquinone/menaquinone biosynthesis C-methylase UbiE
MYSDSEQQIAVAFGIESVLLPVLPELLADIWALGSWPEKIVDLLRSSTTLHEGASVVDLGCGKGAVAIPIAQDLSFRVHGIDLFPPFLEEARSRAESAGVSELCRFDVGDLRRTVKARRKYDVAVLAGVGAIGDFGQTVLEVRRIVRPRGVLVIDDGFLKDDLGPTPPGYEYYRSHGETVRELTSHGDRLMLERLVSAEELKEYNRANTESIRRRAAEVASRSPELAEALKHYVQSEEEECAFLEGRTTAAIWLLERS